MATNYLGAATHTSQGQMQICSTPNRGTGSREAKNEQESKRKHISTPEINQTTCARCDNQLGDDRYSRLQCEGCRLLFCARCTGLQSTVLQFIISGALDDYDWHCKSCKHTKPTLENINQTLQEMRDKQEVRLTTLEEKVKRVDLTVKDVVKTEVNNAKENIMSDIETTINDIVNKKTNELEDIRRRELNVVVFNLPEANNDAGRINKEIDERKITKLAKEMGLDCLLIETSYRLGKKQLDTTPRKPRPLKIILKEKRHRKFLLDNSKNISSTEDKELRKVVIVKDLTPQQRQDRKTKRENKAKQAKQEQNLLLRPVHDNSTSSKSPRAIVDHFGVLNQSNVLMEVGLDDTIQSINDPDCTIQGGIHSQIAMPDTRNQSVTNNPNK